MSQISEKLQISKVLCYYFCKLIKCPGFSFVSNLNLFFSDVVIVQSLSRVWLCNAMGCNTPVLKCLPEFAQTHVHWVIDAIQPFHPLLPLSLTLNLSSIRVFCNEWALCIRWPKCWSFSFSLSPSNEYSGLKSFRIDWFDFLPVQGTLKSFLQHHNSKALVLWCSALFRPYGPTLRWL